jgi:signal transduction histidine kinase
MTTEPPSRFHCIAKDLRAIAEAKVDGETTATEQNELDALKLFQELHVHQVELEIQHEELDRAAAQVHFLLSEYSDLYDFAPVGYFTIDRGGLILRANLTAATMLRRARNVLSGLPMRRLIAPESRGTFSHLLAGLDRTDIDHVCVVTLISNARSGNRDPAQRIVQINAVPATESGDSFRMTMTDITERRLLETQRATQAERIRELSRNLVRIQEQERCKLGIELHDRTSGNLAALDLMLKDLAEQMAPCCADKFSPQLEDIKALLLETTHGIRDMSSSIRPPLLDHCGLAPALEDYLSRFGKRTNINVEFSGALTRDIGTELETTLFRITQEALTNCAKHSHAKNIRVKLKSMADKTVLVIADDGHGFQEESLFNAGAEPGLGIISMKERTEFLGGQFVLKTTPKGTRIVVSFRLTPAQRHAAWIERQRERRQQA